MTNDFAPARHNASFVLSRVGGHGAVAGSAQMDLNAVYELMMTADEVSERGFAPLVVAQSVESALVLAETRLLPSPARILATLFPEGLASLRLPEPDLQDGISPKFHGRVVFALDGSAESRRAAEQAAQRARVAGWTLDVLSAPEGSCWLDVHAGRASPPEEDLARIRDLWVPCPDADPYETASDMVGKPDGGLPFTGRAEVRGSD